MLHRFDVKSALAVSKRVLFLFLLSLLLHQPAFAGQERLKWFVDTIAGIKSSPAIGLEGIVYVGSIDDHLWAIEPDGDVKWRFDTGEDVRQPPVVTPDDTIYVGTHKGRVFALNPDGTPKAGWETPFDPGIGSPVNGEMALSADGTLYVSIGGSVASAMIFALNPDKSVFWTFEPGTGVRGIAIGPGGVVVLSDANGRIYVLDSFGKLIWDRDDSNGITAPVIFAEDGSIILATNSELIMYDVETGDIKWEVDIDTAGNSPSTAVNGDIYLPVAITAGQGGVVCIDPADGSEKWRFPVPGRVNSTPAVGFDGTVYFGSDDNKFYAINPPGVGSTLQGGGASLLWSFETGGDIDGSPTIAENGTLYIGSDDGMLYALNGDSPGLAASSSPKKQRDVAYTGQFGSDRTRRRFFAPHVYWLSDDSNAVVIVRHIGGAGGNPVGTTAEFRIDVLDRDGSVRFSIEDSVGLSNRFSVIFFRACREELLHLCFPAGQVQVLPAG